MRHRHVAAADEAIGRRIRVMATRAAVLGKRDGGPEADRGAGAGKRAGADLGCRLLACRVSRAGHYGHKGVVRGHRTSIHVTIPIPLKNEKVFLILMSCLRLSVNGL